MKRRIFLKGTLAGSAVAVAVGAGLLTPSQVLAAWPKDAFEATSIDDAMSKLLGATDAADSGDIEIKAPEIAENGAVVPVTVTANIDGIESITIIAAANNTPLTSTFNLGSNTNGLIGTRIKMGKSSDVVAVVKAGGKLYKASRQVKVTIGGCGG